MSGRTPRPSDESREQVMENDGHDLEEQVMSEVHLGCPPGLFGPHLSRFTISLLPGVDVKRCKGLFKDVEEDGCKEQGVFADEDGDLVLPRCRHLSKHNFNVTIQHNITSSISNVGLQVWKAELLLSDFVLHKMFTSSELDGIIALELGAGTGLVGMILAHVAKTVFLTDCGYDILDNCVRNVERNAGVLEYRDSVLVRELDWFTSWPPTVSQENTAHDRRYSWTSSEISEAESASLLVAADVIYSDDLTDALFNVLERLMSLGSEKVLYLALEKRYNFTLHDLNMVANGYSHFRSYLSVGAVDGIECLNTGSSGPFMGKCVDVSQIPKYVGEYDRGNDLELWQINYNQRRRMFQDA